MNHDWTEKLRERLDGMEVGVPDGVWDEILHRVDAAGGSAPRRHQRLAAWRGRRWAVAAATLLLLGLGGAMWPHLSRRWVSVPAGAVVDASFGTTPELEPSNRGVVEPPMLVEAPAARSVEPARRVATRHAPVDGPTPDAPTAIDASDDDTVSTVMPTEASAEPSAVADTVAPPLPAPDAPLLADVQPRRRGHGRSRTTTHVGIEGSNLHRLGIRGAAAGPELPVGFALKPPTAQDGDAARRRAHIHHYLPVGAEVSVHRQLDESWGLSGGLSATLLRSDLTTARGYHYRQMAYYVGVPFGASYTLLDLGRWSATATAGGEVARCVALYDSPTPAARPWQLSVGAGVGLHYRLTDGLDVYVQPRVRWYFDDHSSLYVIYDPRPLGFDLHVGLRLDLD